MNRSPYFWLLSILHWICNFFIASLVVGLVMGVYAHLQGRTETHTKLNKSGSSFTHTVTYPTGFILNGIPAQYLFEPVTKLDVIIGIQDFMSDTLIRYTFENEFGRSGNGEYSVRSELEETMGSEFYKEDKKDKQEKLRNGTYKIWDTYTSKLTAYSMPFNYSGTYSPQALKQEFNWELSKPDQWGSSSVQIRAKTNWDKTYILITNWIQAILPSIGLVLVIFQLSFLFRNLRKETFTLANFRLVRRVGIALLLIWFGNYAGNIRNYLLGLSLQNLVLDFDSYLNGLPTWPKMVRFGVTRYDINTLFQFNLTLVTGLIVIVLAEVFRRGVELQKEQDLTI